MALSAYGSLCREEWANYPFNWRFPAKRLSKQWQGQCQGKEQCQN